MLHKMTYLVSGMTRS